MIKILTATCLIALINLSANAADFLSCEVTYDVLTNGICNVCVDHGGDGCVDWQKEPCLIASTKKANVENHVLHPQQEFFVVAQDSQFQFLLSQSRSGYSGRLTYKVDGSELQFENSTPLDPYFINLAFKLKTKSTGAVSGDVTHVRLQCASK